MLFHFTTELLEGTVFVIAEGQLLDIIQSDGKDPFSAPVWQTYSL